MKMLQVSASGYVLFFHAFMILYSRFFFYSRVDSQVLFLHASGWSGAPLTHIWCMQIFLLYVQPSWRGQVGVEHHLHMVSFSGFVHARATSQEATPSPQLQRSRVLSIDDVKIFMTARKLVKSLQNSTGDNTPGTEKQDVLLYPSPASS